MVITKSLLSQYIDLAVNGETRVFGCLRWRAVTSDLNMLRDESWDGSAQTCCLVQADLKIKCSANGFGCNRCTLNLGQTIFDAPTKNSNLFRLLIFGAILGITCTPFGCSKICLCWFNFLALPKIHSTKTARSPEILEFHRISPLKNIHIPRKTLSFPPISLPKSRPQGPKASRNGLPQLCALLRLHRRPTAAAPERRPAVPAPRRAAAGGAAAGRCGRRCLWIWHRDVAW